MNLLLDNTVDNKNFGRIVTFTWPWLPRTKLVELAKSLGIRTRVPATNFNSAVELAVVETAEKFRSGNYRRFSRKLKDNVTELVQEVLIAANDGEVKGERITLARFVVTGNGYVVRCESDTGRAMVEGDENFAAAFDNRVQYYLDTVAGGAVGQWADNVVDKEMGGLALDSRGHSYHVVASMADRLDKFMVAMRELSEGQESVFYARTVDDSPETLASLLSSMKKRVGEAMEDARRAAANSKTERGIDGAVKRLEAVGSLLQNYATLFGKEGQDLSKLLEEAVCSIAMANVISAVG